MVVEDTLTAVENDACLPFLAISTAAAVTTMNKQAKGKITSHKELHLDTFLSPILSPADNKHTPNVRHIGLHLLLSKSRRYGIAAGRRPKRVDRQWRLHWGSIFESWEGDRLPLCISPFVHTSRTQKPLHMRCSHAAAHNQPPLMASKLSLTWTHPGSFRQRVLLRVEEVTRAL